MVASCARIQAAVAAAAKLNIAQVVSFNQSLLGCLCCQFADSIVWCAWATMSADKHKQSLHIFYV